MIVNLVDQLVEEYTRPQVGQGRYAQVTPYPIGKRIELRTATKPLGVQVAKLLPP